jgi:hypothetical protein
MVGFGRPTSISNDPEKLIVEDMLDQFKLSSEIKELQSWPHSFGPGQAPDVENIRPSTPPNLLIPSLQTTCKKSVISDYFRPVQPGTSVTEQLLLSHRSSPFTSASKRELEEPQLTSWSLKRLPSILDFCSSPVRPSSKLARSGHNRQQR